MRTMSCFLGFLLMSACSANVSEAVISHGVEGPTAVKVDATKMKDHINELQSLSYGGRLPGTEGERLAVAYVEKQFEALGLAKKFTDSYRQYFDYSGSKIANVIGVMEGTDDALKQEVILVTSHLDHLGQSDDCKGNSALVDKLTCPGADDNASGVAAMLEMARLAVENSPKPKRTVVFIAFNAEEQGLYGSKYYVANPLFPLANVKAALNLDMVGAGDGSGVTLLGTLKSNALDQDPARYWILTLMKKSAKNMGLNYEVLSWKPDNNADCFPLDDAGVSCVFIWSNPDSAHNQYHTPKDNISIISTKALLATGQLVWAVLQPLSQGIDN